MPAPTSEILFDKFQIIEVLKKDDHAAVFLADHIYLSKKIILKVLNTQRIPDSSIVERFKREAKILAKLDHPNIIKVLDFGMSKEYFYISFEYIDGDSLRNTLKNKSLSAEQKERLTIQFLRGLDFAHKNGIIHRDIKPENIFIDKNLNVKLGDFGLALSAEDNFVTNPYSIVGTPSYMSPEQIRGAKLTLQSDLFSAGVVLFELYTGKNPFLRDNVSLTLNEINGYDEFTLEEKLTGVSDQIKKVLLKLLKKTPGHRYSSAEEVLKELNAWVEYPTVVVNIPEQAGIRTKLIWLLGSLCILILLGILFIPRKEADKQNAPSVSPPQGGDVKNSNTVNPVSLTATRKDSLTNQAELRKGNEAQSKNSIEGTVPGVTQQPQTAKTDDSRKPLYGGLVLDSRPYAQVSIDGQQMGWTPFKNAITLFEGGHTVTFVVKDYPPLTKDVYIKAGEVTNLNFRLDSKMGAIRVSVIPWGDVYVDNDLKAKEVRSPRLLIVRPDPSITQIKIKNPGNNDIDTTVMVHEGDTLNLKFLFKNK